MNIIYMSICLDIFDFLNARYINTNTHGNIISGTDYSGRVIIVEYGWNYASETHEWHDRLSPSTSHDLAHSSLTQLREQAWPGAANSPYLRSPGYSGGRLSTSRALLPSSPSVWADFPALDQGKEKGNSMPPNLLYLLPGQEVLAKPSVLVATSTPPKSNSNQQSLQICLDSEKGVHCQPFNGPWRAWGSQGLNGLRERAGEKEESSDLGPELSSWYCTASRSKSLNLSVSSSDNWQAYR